MQRFIILTYLILFSLSSKNVMAQYESMFGAETIKWDILLGACDHWCSTSYTTMGDTVINAQSYRVISDSAGFNPFFLREDTTQGKVWSYESDLNSEHLLIDLTLSVGDSFPIFNDMTNQTEYYSVDTVFYVNGRKHVSLNNFGNLCSHISHPVIFTEGVGTSTGLSYHNGYYKAQIILCYTKNDTVSRFYDDNYIYPGYFYIDSCDYCVSSVHQLSNTVAYKIYPNPATNHLTVALEKPEELVAIEIYNLFGQLIEISQQNRLNISNYPKIFLIKVKTESGTVVEKILRQ